MGDCGITQKHSNTNKTNDLNQMLTMSRLVIIYISIEKHIQIKWNINSAHLLIVFATL